MEEAKHLFPSIRFKCFPHPFITPSLQVFQDQSIQLPEHFLYLANTWMKWWPFTIRDELATELRFLHVCTAFFQIPSLVTRAMVTHLHSVKAPLSVTDSTRMSFTKDTTDLGCVGLQEGKAWLSSPCKLPRFWHFLTWIPPLAFKAHWFKSSTFIISKNLN